MNEFVKEIASTMKQSKTKAYDTVAKVLRVDEKTAYVHIDGGADETPAQMAINCKTGDTVKIRVSGGKAWITGNITAPPTDDSTAEVAQRAVNAVAKFYGRFAGLTVGNFKAVNADIERLNTKKLDAESAKIKFANIDFSNIGKAAMEYFYAQSGLIKDVVVGDQKITGHLIGVTISGDLIEGNTVKAEKLVVLGEDGLYYKLNVNALGEAVASSDAKYQNGLDGSVIIAKSVTAEKVSVKDLVAFGATIGGLNITDGSIYSGVKDSINNTTQGFYVDKNGQLYLGDAEHFLRYYKAKDGTYKLAISAKSVTFGSSQNLEEAWEETKTSIESKIETVDVEYYLSTSATSLSGGSWSTTAPTWTNGKYMWMRTKITDGAGNVTYSPDENGTCITGATGATGSSGKGITSIVEEYYQSTSATTLSGGSWSTTPPTWVDGKYIWTRSVITYTDNTVKRTEGICATGQKGDKGEKGDAGPRGLQGLQGERGEQGIPGKDGSNGTNGKDGSPGSSLVTLITPYTYPQESIAEYSKDDYSGTWSVDSSKNAKVGDTVLLRVNNSTKGGYSFIVAKITDIPSATSITCTSRGLVDNGANGKTSYFHIKYSSVANPTSSSQMTETPNIYIGTYVDYVETDSSDPSKYTWSRFTGAQGPKGEQGIPGIGVDGKTSYLHIAYANSSDGRTGFSISDSTNKLFIGQYTDFSPDDSTDPSKYKWTLIKGATGPQGPQGEKGEDANQIVHVADGNGNSKMYMALATFTITANYVNTPIQFKITSRGREASNVQIMFGSIGNHDPGLGYFREDGNVPIWIQKIATSTWRLIGAKNESWGAFSIGQYCNLVGVQVEWTSEHLDSVPESTNSNPVYYVDYLAPAKTATNFMKYEDGTGLIVGDMRGDTLSQNTLLDSNGMAVRNGNNEIVRFGTAPIVITNTNGDKTYEGSGSVMQSGNNIVVSTQQTKDPDDIHSGGKAALELYYDKAKDITGLSLTVKGGSTYSDLYESMGTGMYVDNNHIQVVSDDVECILGKNNILWDANNAGYWMLAQHKFTLNEPISMQPTGAVFVWSHYSNGAVDNWWWTSFFVPKQHVAWQPGGGMLMCNPYYGLNKYIYIADTFIQGNDNNKSNNTQNGIAVDNQGFVLRYVLGV